MKLKNPGIKYIDYYIPSEILGIDNFINSIKLEVIPKSFKDLSEYQFFIENILLLNSIRTENNLAEEDMIGSLIEKMVDNNVIKIQDIHLILLAQENKLHQRANISQYIQNKHGIANSYIINVSGNYCANIEVAVNIATSLLRTQSNLHNALIISSTKSRNINDRVNGSYGILADGAGIMLLSDQDPNIQLIDSVTLSNGQLYDISDYTDNSLIHCKYYVDCISQLFEKQKLSNEEIDSIIIQNANPLLVTQCVGSLGIDNEKLFTKNLGKYGHLDWLDFLINLKDLYDQKSKVKEIKNIVSIGSGWAGTYISSLYNIN